MPKSTPTNDPPPQEPPGFEASLGALERCVAALDSGSLNLDASLQAYQEGIAHLARCHALLDAAEQKVKLLVSGSSDGSLRLDPFEGANTEI